MVEKLAVIFPIKVLCKVLGITRSAYYCFLKGSTYQVSFDKQILLNEVKIIFDKHRKRYGSRRIREELQDNGYKVGKYRVSSLMKEQGLVAIQPKSFVPKTTQSHPHLNRCPNLLLNEASIPQAPNKLIVGDITYLPSEERGYKVWLYMATWMDFYTRKIVGWRVDDNMEEQLVIESLKKVIRSQQPAKGFIVHSDGGGQYASKAFKKLIATNKFTQSMTRKDNHYDNAHAESLFSRFKAELLNGGVFYGLEDAQSRTFEYIEGYYNTVRKHSSISYLSPNQFEERYWTDFYAGNVDTKN